MKYTLDWLGDYLEAEAPLEVGRVSAAMTAAGLEVEKVEDPAAELGGVSVARVVEARSHPDADKLKVCEVETRNGPRTVVCGAPNARAPMTVAYAEPGAWIPGAGFRLDAKPRRIRGVESAGMLCSGAELGVGADADGILDLSEALEVGTPVADALELAPVIDFEVTPNRPDWLGVRGIARDLAAAGLGEFRDPGVEPVEGAFAPALEVRLETDACPAFAWRVVRGVSNGQSPEWLRARLEAVGLRPISALVDITNFMTLDAARPLHVYDLRKLAGDIRVRMGADGGESVAALDGHTYRAGPEDIVIADSSGAIGLGGIVGGESTGVSAETTDVLIECALFDPLTIRRTAKRLGVNSDAKYRFERGVDTGYVEAGLERATRLVLETCGGEASEARLAGAIPPPPAPIAFDPARVGELTGLELGETRVAEILSDLGFGVELGEKSWRVEVPTWRRDCAEPADLVEEVARIAGYDALEAVSLPPIGGRRRPTATPLQTRVRRARRALAERGLLEAVTWSFAQGRDAELFGGGDLRLANPISAELDVMRPSALIHLLRAGQRAADRGYGGAALFEAGPVYRGLEPEDQSLSLAGMRRAEAPRDWRGARAPDAFTAKADALAALGAMGAKVEALQTGAASGRYWHPGRAGRLQLGPKRGLAEFGELHPGVLKAMGVEGRVVAFEVWPEALPPARRADGPKTRAAFQPSDLMPVHRDFAFVVSEGVSAGALIRAARGADKTLITDVSLFDVYEGLEDGRRSLAIDVELTPTDKTLTDAEIEAVSAKLVAKVEALGAELRG